VQKFSVSYRWPTKKNEVGLILTVLLSAIIVATALVIRRAIAVLRTIGLHKPDRIAVVCVDSSVLYDCPIFATALITIPSGRDCS